MRTFALKTALNLAINFFKNGGRSPFTALRIGKIKATMWYLQGIKTTRLLFISIIGVVISLIFLVAGIAVFHTGIFYYATWSNEVKMYVTFTCAAIYGISALYMLAHIFDEKKWVSIFNAQSKIDYLSELTKLEKEHV